jgi:hypothetical protein
MSRPSTTPNDTNAAVATMEIASAMTASTPSSRGEAGDGERYGPRPQIVGLCASLDTLVLLFLPLMFKPSVSDDPEWNRQGTRAPCMRTVLR